MIKWSNQSGLGRERSRKVLGDANSEQLKGQLGIVRKNRLSLIGTAIKESFFFFFLNDEE